MPATSRYAGSACSGHTHARLSGWPMVSAPSAPTGATTTWVTKCASDSSVALRRSTSSGNTPLSPSALVGYASSRFPVAGSTTSWSKANVCRSWVGGRLSPSMLASNAVRDCSASCTVSATCAPGGTSVASRTMTNPAPGAIHALCWASENVGALLCAAAGTAWIATSTEATAAPATTHATAHRAAHRAAKRRERRVTTSGRARTGRPGGSRTRTTGTARARVSSRVGC